MPDREQSLEDLMEMIANKSIAEQQAEDMLSIYAQSLPPADFDSGYLRYVHEESPAEMWSMKQPQIIGAAPQDEYRRTGTMLPVGDSGMGMPMDTETSYERVGGYPMQVERKVFQPGMLLGMKGEEMPGGGYDFSGSTMPSEEDVALEILPHMRGAGSMPGSSDVPFPRSTAQTIPFTPGRRRQVLGF